MLSTADKTSRMRNFLLRCRQIILSLRAETSPAISQLAAHLLCSLCLISQSWCSSGRLGASSSNTTMLLQISCPQCSTNCVGKGKEDICNGDCFEEGSWYTKTVKVSVRSCERQLVIQLYVKILPGISRSVLLHKLLPLTSRPAFELEVACMCCGSSALALKQHEHDRTNDGNKIEGKIH